MGRGGPCTDFEFMKSGHHDLGVIRVQQVPQPAGAAPECGQHEGAIRNALRSGRGHADRALRGDSGDDLGGLGECLDDDGVGHDAGLLLHGRADAGEQHDLLLRPAVLLVDPHDVQQAVDAEQPRRGHGRDARIGERDGQVVALEAARQTADADLSEVAQLAGHLGLEDHPHADALAVQDARRQHGLDRVPDRVPKVDEVAQARRLALVVRHDVRLDGDRADDDGEEQLLRRGARRLCAARVVHARRLDGGDDLCRSRLERRKVRFVPDRRGLFFFFFSINKR